MMPTLLLTAMALSCAHAAALGYAQPYQPPAPYAPYSDYDDYYLLPKPIVRYSYYPLPPWIAPMTDPEDPLRLEERAAREAALPIGQETWYESEPPAPRWRQAGLDDVNAAFLQNLIISQMARNAENRARALPPLPRDDRDEMDAYGERDTRDFEDEDVRELKALAGKPLYHSAKTEPRNALSPIAPTNNYDYYDYAGDDSFINWGNKRAAPEIFSTAAPQLAAAASSAASAAAGQREEVMLRPATPVRHPFAEPVMQMLQAEWHHDKRSASVYDKIKHMLAAESDERETNEERPRLKKRFVATEPDLVAELRGLKRRIAT